MLVYMTKFNPRTCSCGGIMADSFSPYEETYEKRNRVFSNISFKNAVSLDENLREMNSSERSSVLAAEQLGFLKGTPLIAAVREGCLDVVKVLLKYKADIEVAGEYQRLRRVLSDYDYDNIVLKYKGDIEASAGAKYQRRRRGLFDVDDDYIDNHMYDDDNWVLYTCCTPLFLAAAYGHLDISRCLIENGADVNACSDDNCTPLMVAIQNGHINVATFLIEHGANVDLKDKDCYTALHYALYYQRDSLEVCRCLIENGAEINVCNENRAPNISCTPLMIGSRYGRLDAMTFLIKHGADVYLQDKDGETALHYAIDGSDASCEVLSCLIENGADLNAFSNNECTPLIKAILYHKVTAATFLTKNGANMDLQNKYGDTALHFAVRANLPEFADHLVTLGASHMCNNQGFTPLLEASNTGNSEVVECLIKRPEITKEQRIDALELLGASVVFMYANGHEKGFKYIKRGMEERFSDPSQLLLKQPMEPVEANQNRKECQTLEDLAQIEGDLDAVVIEGVIIRERIIGNKSPELLFHVHCAARTKNLDFSTCMRLHRHVVKMTQSSSQSAVNELDDVSRTLHRKFLRSDQPKAKNHVLELLELTLLEYETQHKVRKQTNDEHEKYSLSTLCDISTDLVSFISKFEFCEESKTLYLSTLLRKLCSKDPRDQRGNTPLHKVIKDHMDDDVYSSLDILKILLNAGFNVNTVNKNGDTPLHLAVTFRPSNDKICLVTDMLKVLFDGGAHHDFVNSDGKTPMDLAQTDEACMILSESRNIELHCISARAVRKFRIPYFGVVPKILEKYILMHRSGTPSTEERLRRENFLH